MSNITLKPYLTAVLLGLITATSAAANESAKARFQYSESREPCLDFAPHKKPLFGDLHTHSSLSFDSYLSSQRNGPTETYQYAKGYPITLPDADGKQTVTAQIDRPLDFAHSPITENSWGKSTPVKPQIHFLVDSGQCAYCRALKIFGCN